MKTFEVDVFDEFKIISFKRTTYVDDQRSLNNRDSTTGFIRKSALTHHFFEIVFAFMLMQDSIFLIWHHQASLNIGKSPLSVMLFICQLIIVCIGRIFHGKFTYSYLRLLVWKSVFTQTQSHRPLPQFCRSFFSFSNASVFKHKQYRNCYRAFQNLYICDRFYDPSAQSVPQTYAPSPSAQFRARIEIRYSQARFHLRVSEIKLGPTFQRLCALRLRKKSLRLDILP